MQIQPRTSDIGSHLGSIGSSPRRSTQLTIKDLNGANDEMQMNKVYEKLFREAQAQAM